MWTEKKLQQLRDSGMIRSFTGKSNNRDKKTNKIDKRSKQKDFISWNLTIWCQEQKTELITEHRFDEVRKWRFDWAIPQLMIAVEYEGLNSEKSRHTTKKGFTGDTDKYNRAQVLGWKVFRVTALNYKTIIQTLNSIK